MIRVNISYDLRAKLEQEWYGEYSSGTCFYPFFMWSEIKYKAELIRNGKIVPFAFDFKNQEEAEKFIERYKDYLDVGKNEVDT